MAQKNIKVESVKEFEKILSNYVLVDTPYFGVPESQYIYVNDNFKNGQAVLELRPPDGSTIIEPEDNNIELITKDVIYSMSGVSEKQYDEWYQEYKEHEYEDGNESHKTLKYIKLFEEFTGKKDKLVFVLQDKDNTYFKEFMMKDHVITSKSKKEAKTFKTKGEANEFKRTNYLHDFSVQEIKK